LSFQIENIVEALHVAGGVAVEDFDHEAWSRARPAHIARYWSGESAPPEKHAEARAVWDDKALVVRFVCRQAEPLVVAAAPNLREKCIGLWDRDVCEIFIAPDAHAPERYFEFEAAPTGEWLDLAIHWRPQGRETDWRYRSRMQAAARVNEGVLTIAMRLPFKSLGRTPRANDRWRANLFRCVGTHPLYRYLAWQPTHTEQPNFHVPERFGWLAFKG
jgi:alpha-galactosidase